MTHFASGNPHRVPRKPAEPGAAHAGVVTDRRHKSIESKYGVIGARANFNAPTIQTTETGGDPSNYYPGMVIDQSGLRAYNSGGTLTLNIDAATGAITVQTNSSPGSDNTITWKNGSTEVGGLFGTYGGGGTTWSETLYAGTLASSDASISVAHGLTDRVSAQAGTVAATLLSDTGDGTWPGDLTANSFIPTSSRTLKQGWEDLDSDDILRKLCSLDIKGYERISDPGVRGVGPVAEDFYEQFGLGPYRPYPWERTEDRHQPVINLMDLSGVTIVGLQALAARVETLERSSRILRDAFLAGATFEEARSNLRCAALLDLETQHFLASITGESVDSFEEEMKELQQQEASSER